MGIVTYMALAGFCVLAGSIAGWVGIGVLEMVQHYRRISRP